MMPSDAALACRVCGYLNDEPPWGEDGRTPSHDICPCCGTEWGYDDASPAGVEGARRRWLDGGARWHQPKARPADRDAQRQLAAIGATASER